MELLRLKLQHHYKKQFGFTLLVETIVSSDAAIYYRLDTKKTVFIFLTGHFRNIPKKIVQGIIMMNVVLMT